MARSVLVLQSPSPSPSLSGYAALSQGIIGPISIDNELSGTRAAYLVADAVLIVFRFVSCVPSSSVRAAVRVQGPPPRLPDHA